MRRWEPSPSSGRGPPGEMNVGAPSRYSSPLPTMNIVVRSLIMT